MLASLLPILGDTFWLSSLAAGAIAPRAASPASVDNVSVVTCVSEMRRLKSGWERLADVTAGPVPFHTFDWSLRAAQAGRAAGAEPVIVVVGAPERPRLIMPLSLTRRGPFRVLGWLGDPVAQYGDVLSAPNARTADLEEALRATRRLGADLLWLRRVRGDAALGRYAADAALLRGERDAAPSVILGEAPVERETSAKQKRHRRSAMRKLEAIGPIGLEVLEGEAASLAAEEAIALKRDWLSQRGLERSPLFDPVWAACLVELAGQRGGLVSRLTVGGQAASIEIGFVHRGHYAAYLGSFHPDFAQATPGKIHTDMMLERCAEGGLETYDFLAPADPYKMRWATRTVEVGDRLMPLTLRGRAMAFAAVHARPALKRWQAHLPVALRRGLARILRGV